MYRIGLGLASVFKICRKFKSVQQGDHQHWMVVVTMFQTLVVTSAPCNIICAMYREVQAGFRPFCGDSWRWLDKTWGINAFDDDSGAGQRQGGHGNRFKPLPRHWRPSLAKAWWTFCVVTALLCRWNWDTCSRPTFLSRLLLTSLLTDL